MSIGRTTVVMMGLLIASSAFGVTIKDAQRIKDPNGNTLVLVVACDGCKGGKPKKPGVPCLPGAVDGFWDGQPCGQCLMKSNFNSRVGYAYDLHLTGALKDAKSQPLANQFVKLNMPNGWSVTSRTNEKGEFRLVLGATDARATKAPLVRDLGTFTFKKSSGMAGAFSLFMLPEGFKPCAAK